MLDYTIAAGKRVWRNIRITSFVFNILVQVVSIFFLTYILFKGQGVFAINLVLLVLSVAYLAFFCTTLAESKRKVLKRRVKQVFSWSKRAIKLVNLGIMLYAIFTAKDRTMADVVIAVCSLGFWVLDLLFELASMAVRSWGLLLYEGVKADVEEITAPFSATGNFFKRLTGQEVKEKPLPNKKRKFLDGLVSTQRRERENQKIEEQNLKVQEKADKKAMKLAEKLLRKAAKKNKVQEEIAPSENEE